MWFLLTEGKMSFFKSRLLYWCGDIDLKNVTFCGDIDVSLCMFFFSFFFFLFFFFFCLTSFLFQ